MPNKEHHSIRSVESVLCPQRQKLQQFRHPVAPKKTIDILTEEVPLKGHRGTQVPTTLMFGDMLTCQMFEKNHKRWLQGFVRSWMIKGLIESVCTLFCSHHLEVFPEHNAPQKCLRTWVSGSKTTRVYSICIQKNNLCPTPTKHKRLTDLRAKNLSNLSTAKHEKQDGSSAFSLPVVRCVGPLWTGTWPFKRDSNHHKWCNK